MHQSTTKTTTTTTTITTKSTALPDWIGLGKVNYGCSYQTAEFCKNFASSKKSKKSKPNQRRRAKMPRNERKRRRRKRRKEKKAQKRKEKRKRKRMLRRQRQRLLRKQNRNSNRVFTMGDIALTTTGRRDNRKFQWSKSKIPPFEALLSSSTSSVNSENNQNNNQNQENSEEFEELTDPSSYFDEMSSSDFQTKTIKNGGRKRTPPPLKEAKDDLLINPDKNQKGDDQRGWKKRKRK